MPVNPGKVVYWMRMLALPVGVVIGVVIYFIVPAFQARRDAKDPCRSLFTAAEATALAGVPSTVGGGPNYRSCIAYYGPSGSVRDEKIRVVINTSSRGHDVQTDIAATRGDDEDHVVRRVDGFGTDAWVMSYGSTFLWIDRPADGGYLQVTLCGKASIDDAELARLRALLLPRLAAVDAWLRDIPP